MFGGEHERAFIEQVYKMTDKNVDQTTNMFLDGNLPAKNIKDEIHVIIEEKQEKKIEIKDTTLGQI